jgi:hypothetical protein
MKKLLTSLSAALVIASASIGTTYAAPTAQLSGGYTLVELAPGFVSALTSLNVRPGQVLPGALVSVAYFPITSGRLDLANAKGEVAHSGGLSLTAGNTRVELTDFIIDTTGTPRLTGLVTANNSIVGRIPLFNIALPASLTLPLAAPAANQQFVLHEARLTLTSDAATALNGAFNVTAFAAGLAIGSAAINGNVR